MARREILGATAILRKLGNLVPVEEVVEETETTTTVMRWEPLGELT